MQVDQSIESSQIPPGRKPAWNLTPSTNTFLR
jgi:hypothetical protein